MIAYAQQNAPFAGAIASQAATGMAAGTFAPFGAGPAQGVSQSQLPQSSYVAPLVQQTTGVTATSSNTSLGFSAFVGGIDMTGISPLTVTSAAPTAPSAAIPVTTAPTVASLTSATVATGPVLSAAAQTPR